MSTFEEGAEQEVGDDQAWEAYVGRLKKFLHDESVLREIEGQNDDSYSETPIDGHAAAEALERIEDGDFEAVTVYLNGELEKIEGDIRAARDDQSRLAPLEVRKSILETLRNGLERQ